MDKLINRYYLTTFISELARTIPHPILIILLIEQKHLTLSQITFVQIFFYLGVLLFEIPSGYLADLGYRKSGYIGSFVCMLTAYGLIYSSSSIITLSIAWFIYGIAGALTSGNVDGYIVNKLKENDLEGQIKPFNVKKTNMSLIAGIGGALIGSLLYPIISVNIYLFSLILYTIAILIALFGIKIEHSKGTIDKLSIRDLDFTKQIKLLLIMVCIIELYYVGFYQYWQVLYQSKGIDPTFFGIIYITFSLTVITSNKLYSKVDKIKDYVVIPIFVLSTLVSLFVADSILFCVIYPITLFIANLYVIDLYTTLYKVVDEKSISSMISIVSSVNRVFGIIILAILTVLLPLVDLNILLLILYIIFGTSFLILRGIFTQKKQI
ncbi:MFS transporter [Mollicutes bacterium LVI A0078]|nr:MFS transporter [Mollicutes bacterium LVI A0075]WOO91232.1 MFS transporter [Mollicutes bacterium LVI A0078]